MRLLLRTAPMVLVMAAIFFLSHQNGDTLDIPSFPGADKLAHMSVYGILALSILWYYGERGAETTIRTAVLTVLFCLAYGLSDEFHQSFVPLRFVSGFDIMADAAGATAIVSFWSRSFWLRQKISVM